MLLYVLCFLFGMLVLHTYHVFFGNNHSLENDMMKQIRLGKKVVICVDNHAMIMQLEGGKVKITEGLVDFFVDEEKTDE